MDSAVDVSESLELDSSHHDLARRVSSSLGVSTSPTSTFAPSSWKVTGGGPQRSNTGTTSKQLKPFNTEDIKILLLENVNQTGQDLLEAQGYQVTSLKKALPEDELIEKIRWGNASLSLSGT
jgi:D-3-phosphoglycerate dehydrogenase